MLPAATSHQAHSPAPSPTYPNPNPNPNPIPNPNPNPNQVYYYNAQTKVSTYDKPPGFKDPITGSTK